jgi:hypothetical protein
MRGGGLGLRRLTGSNVYKIGKFSGQSRTLLETRDLYKQKLAGNECLRSQLVQAFYS